jgi:TRAP-type C4-dicarboxylate transport system permease small subunit
VVWGVFSRYLLGYQSGWTEELARALLIWVGLLGSSVAFGLKGHLGVDALVVRLAPGAQRLVAILVHLAVIFFAASVLIGGGSQLVRETFRLEQQMIAISLSKAWVYMAIPISGVFTILFSLELIVETWRGGAQKEGSGFGVQCSGVHPDV